MKKKAYLPHLRVGLRLRSVLACGRDGREPSRGRHLDVSEEVVDTYALHLQQRTVP